MSPGQRCGAKRSSYRVRSASVPSRESEGWPRCGSRPMAGCGAAMPLTSTWCGRCRMSGPEIRRRLVALAAWCGAAACVVTSLWVYVGISDRLRGNEAAPWMLARASGFTSYLLMMSLVLVGLLLAHPGATRLRGLNRATRLRIHIALATFTLAFTTLHVVVLALDPFAGLGWRGALLPMAAGYRPVAVTLGVLAVWSALLSGLTAALAGRLTLRIWWPIHKVAVVAFGLAWAHGLLAGTD